MTKGSNVISIKDLIDRKKELSGRVRKQQTVFVNDLDGNVEVIEPTIGILSDMREMGGSSDDKNIMIIASCMVNPNPKSAELLKAYGCVTPNDLVKKLFRIGTIRQLADIIVNMAGFGEGSVMIVEGKVAEEIKN